MPIVPNINLHRLALTKECSKAHLEATHSLVARFIKLFDWINCESEEHLWADRIIETAARQGRRFISR